MKQGTSRFFEVPLQGDRRIFSKTSAVLLAFFVVLSMLVPPSVYADYLGPAEFIAPQDLQHFQDNSISHFTSDTTGAALQKISLTLPPGRGRATPEISLTYNSQSGDNLSPYGYGWGDSIPYIERSNKHGTEKLYTNNDFYSSFDGELLSETSTSTTSFRARVENGSFNKYELVTGDSWLMTDKLGTTYKFGYATTTTRIYDTATSTARIYRWMLQEVRDTNGNYVTYQYYRDGNQLYPYKIDYSGHDADPGIFEVEFSREARSDIATSTQSAFPVVSKYRINQIQVKINGSWVRKYDLGYTTGDNGARSLLASVTETGKDELGTDTALPATTFTYQSSTGRQGWTATTSLSQMPAFTRYDIDNGVRIADMNGDGLTDFAQVASNNHPITGLSWAEKVTKISTGSQLATSTALELPSDIYFTKSNADDGSRLVDVNGDGLTDILSAKHVESSDPTYPDAFSFNKTYINTGSGWTASTTWNSPVAFTGANINQGSFYNPVISDLNGDGLVDFIIADAGTTTRAYINNGAGWTLNTDTWGAFIPGVYLNGETDTLGSPQLIDVNGDHLPDVIKAVQFCHYEEGVGTSCDDPISAVYLNNGSGWDASSTSWTVPFSFNKIILYYPAGTIKKNYDLGVRFDDINGDGLIDVIRSSGGGDPTSCTDCVAFINNGSGWYEDSDWDAPAYFIEHLDPLIYAYDQKDTGARLMDLDGDGLSEIINGGTRYIPANAGYKADLLSKTNQSKGARTTYTYKPASQYFIGTSTPANILPFSLTTLYQSATYDGISATTTHTFSYGSGSYYFHTSLDRRFAGFGTTTDADAAGNSTVTFFHQGNGALTSLGENSDAYAKIGKPYRKEKLDSEGNLFDLTISWWNTLSQGNNRNFVSLAQKVSYAYDGNDSHKDSAESYSYDTYGNLSVKTGWGEVTGSSDGSFSDTGTDKRIATTTYAASSTPYIVGLPSQETLSNQAGTKVRETKHYYDGLSFGNVSVGNETQTERWKTASTYIADQKAYNAYGLIASSTDPRGKVTSYTYDYPNLYIATSTNPLSQQTQFYYDYSLGKPKKTIDSNSRVFETTYDGLDRPLAEKQPDIASPTSLVNKKTYAYTDTVGLRKILETNYLDGSTDFTLYKYLDGLDRVYQTRKEAEESSQFAVKDFAYNTIGLLQKESLPYFSSGSATTTATTNNNLYTAYVYDPLQRMGTTTNAVGTTTTSYDQWATSVTDPLGNERSFVYDAFGRLAHVVLPDAFGMGGSFEDLSIPSDFWSRLSSATAGLSPKMKLALNIPEESAEPLLDILEEDLLVIPEEEEEIVLEEITSLTDEATSTPPILDDTQSENETATTTEDTVLDSVLESEPAESENALDLVSTGTSKEELFFPEGSIRALLASSSPSEHATIKGQEIAKVGSIERTERNGYDIEIVSLEPIQGGIQVFARAWKDGRQVGFGRDGTVDMERFRIFNPPILVDDPDGDVVRTWIDHETGKSREKHLREDPKEALLQVIEHNLSVMKNIHRGNRIIPGKHGNTTSTFYPDASPESTSVDGYTQDDNNASTNRTWAQVHDGDGTLSRQDGSDSEYYIGAIADRYGSYARLIRSHILFDTSAIGSGDDISSATLSVRGLDKYDGQSDSVYISDTNPASNTAIAATDMDGVTVHGGTAYATPITVASFTTSGYNDFSLNGSGIAAIAKTGVSKFSMRLGLDFNETSGHASAPSTSQNYVFTYAADQAGSSNDPKLVVEHSVGGGGDTTTSYTYDAADNLIQIADPTDNVRSFTYDGLNRRLSAEDLHDAGDGTYGIWNYTYDDAGNLASTTDPKSQLINYTYDDINRVLTTDYTGQGGTEVSYAYDSCAEGIGRLCIATSTGAISSFTYNALGLTASESRNIASTTYATSYSYDRQGNPTGIVYPDNSEVEYTYNTAGLLESVAQKESGGGFLNLISDFDYAPIEKVAYKAFTNGVQSTYTYDANALYRLTNIYTTASSTESGVGGGLGFAEFLGSNLARATEQFPLAFRSLFAMLEEPVIFDTGVSSEQAPVTDPVQPPTADAVPETPAPASPDLPIVEIEAASEESTEPFSASDSIQSLIADKSASERASIKGQEIAKAGSIERTSRKGYDIEIVSMEPIPGGVQVFARVWKDGVQIGFGYDGSVDMERFRIFNPPILVSDPEGDIVRTWIDHETGEQKEERLREDPREALLQVIEHNLSVMKNIHTDGKITPDKRGNTTSTFYPDANPESTSTDGWTQDDNTSATNRTWAQMHEGDGTQSLQDGDATTYYLIVIADKHNNSGTQYRLSRSHVLFDTSAIGSGDDISSATLSLRGIDKSDGQSDSVYISDTSPASNTNIVATDMDNMTLHGATSYATPITVSSFSTSGYNDFTFNSSGRAAIAKTGISKFSVRMGLDFNETSGHGSPPGSAQNYIAPYAADQSGSTNDPKLVVEHTASSNVAPLAPTSLLAEGQTNPYFITDSTPEFSAIYEDLNETDVALSYQIQVATSSAFTTTKWDSGKTTLASSTPRGTRIADIAYSGSALASSSLYYWRIKFWDTADLAGEWSAATSSTFTLAPAVGQPAFFPIIQNTTFTYDAVGNITQVRDASDTGLGKLTSYAYDNLYRLTSASTTMASSTPYTRSYEYDTLGSITYASDLGEYTYGETSYTNPHAVTQVANGLATTTYSYDTNGNLITSGSNSFRWDYQNRLASSTVSAINTFYQYDHTMERVAKGNGIATTTYPNKWYETNGTPTKNIYANGELIATILGSGANATTTYIHTDHLGGLNAGTNEDSDTIETVDYLPYGGERISTQYGTQEQSHRYIGEITDAETSLSYLHARMYDGGVGQFLGQDPVFWEVGQTKDGKSILMNPQAQNSYSYAENNPIIKKDPDGRFIPQAIVFGGALGGVINTVSQGYADYQSGQFSGLGNYALAFGKGAAIGAATVANPFLGAGVAGGSSLFGSYLKNGTVTTQDAVNAATEGVITGVTAGYLKGLPQVRGVQASDIFGSTYYTGAHAQRYAGEALFGVGTDSLFKGIQGITSSTINNRGQSSLPSQVNQNGTTYIRNSSGLLNVAPLKK